MGGKLPEGKGREVRGQIWAKWIKSGWERGWRGHRGEGVGVVRIGILLYHSSGVLNKL